MYKIVESVEFQVVESVESVDFLRGQKMSENVKYRLCGGTFFTLLLNDRQPLLPKSQNYSGESSDFSEHKLLWALIRIFKPDIDEKPKIADKSLKDGTHNFKICKNWGNSYFQLGDKSVQSSFDKRIKNHYNDSLTAMIDFTKNFLGRVGKLQK